jgi:hypothetical protein
MPTTRPQPYKAPVHEYRGYLITSRCDGSWHYPMIRPEAAGNYQELPFKCARETANIGGAFEVAKEYIDELLDKKPVPPPSFQ